MIEPNGERQTTAPPILMVQGKARTKRPPTPDDMAWPDDDSLFERRKPSSARVYRRAHLHAVKLTDPPFAVRVEAKPQSQFSDMDWKKSVLIGMAAMCIVIVFGSMAINFVQSLMTDWQYGNPRTFQCDADVRHGGMSHFIVENLNGHIVVIEVLTDHLDRTKIYDGPVLLGKGATTNVAIIRFADLNHDGLPDMLLTVDNALYVYLNDGNVFYAAAIQGGKDAGHQ